MALPISDTASSADEVDDDLCPSHTNYDVFISFRGEDTRNTFTSHLYVALCKKKIRTFMDTKLNRGEEISSTLLKTIEGSEIFVIIFSKDYASSPWCLDELVKILECKERYRRLVIPIFYHVDPSHVRRQTESYANSFIKHSKRFKSDMDKVEKWKAALTQASNISGFDSTKIRPEPTLIGKVVKDILRKLKHSSSCNLEGLVGIHDHISKVESFLNIESQDVRIVGIWGMGGIGKTTIADVIYHKLQPQFESCSFVLSVEEQIRTKGLDHIRDKYLQELLEGEDIGIHSFRSSFVKKLLQQKRVLLVIDDVSKLRQIEDLIKGHDWFGSGSRIIITARDKQVLETANVDEIYHVSELCFNDALQLFSRNAFKQDLPIKDYMALSKEALNYCKGNPLAIKVLGSFLKGRTKGEWNSALEGLQNAPHKDIFEVLILSFDGLDDDEKEIFLDIAVLYDGMPLDSMKESLIKCGFSADIGISVLIDRSLISIHDKDNTYVMHALIRAMGRKISDQKNVYKSRRGCRLWKHDDVYDALMKNKEIEEIYGIYGDVSKINDIYLEPDVFENMHKLQILRLYNSQLDLNKSSQLHISNGLRNFPKKLKLLHWSEYPHTSVPLDWCTSNIVELIMQKSNVKQLWDDNQCLPNLKKLDLRGSDHLTGILDLSRAPNVEYLNVTGCTSLSQVYSPGSVSKLDSFLGFWYDAPTTLNIGGNNVHRRSWRLSEIHEFFFVHPFAVLHGSEIITSTHFTKVSIRILKSDSSNTYRFQFNSISVPLTSISESESESMDSDGKKAVLRPMHANLKSILPSLQLLSLQDNPSSFGFLLYEFPYSFEFLSLRFFAEITKDLVMPSIFPEKFKPSDSLCCPWMKGTGNKEDVLTWDWEEDLIDSLMEPNIYIRLPKCISNNLRWECIRKVSLYRSDILSTFPAASIHNPSSVDSLSLSEYAVELTFSLNSEIPINVSEVSINFAEQQDKYYLLDACFRGNGQDKCFTDGSTIAPTSTRFFLDLYFQS